MIGIILLIIFGLLILAQMSEHMGTTPRRPDVPVPDELCFGHAPVRVKTRIVWFKNARGRWDKREEVVPPGDTQGTVCK